MLFLQASLPLLPLLSVVGNVLTVQALTTYNTAAPRDWNATESNGSYELVKRSSSGNKHRLTLYFVRHGDTDWSEKHIIQGQSDLPLNAKGIEHAKAMGEKLKDLSFAASYTSPLYRALQTIDAVVDARGRTLDHTVDPRLMGQGMGELTGKPYSTVDWSKPESLESYKGVEPLARFTGRLDQFLADIISVQVAEARKSADGSDANVLIVGHGTTFIPMIRRLRKMGGETREQLNADLPVYYEIGTIPVIIIGDVYRIPLDQESQVDWQAVEQKHIPVSMSVMRIAPPEH